MSDILFVAHGTKHPKNNPGYRMLKHTHFTSPRSIFVDMDPDCSPTHVMDVTENNRNFFGKIQFDHIFVIFAHYTVLESCAFWYNVSAWLKPCGIVHTIIPRIMYSHTRDIDYAKEIEKHTDLRILDKRRYMYKRGPALVLQKLDDRRCSHPSSNHRSKFQKI
jgi:hypothetical protein